MVGAVDGQTTPPGWFGALNIDGHVMVTAPDDVRARELTEALAAAAVDDADQLRAAVTTKTIPEVTEVMGPAWLSYAAPTTRHATSEPGVTSGIRVEALKSSNSSDLHTLLGVCSPQDVAESAVEEMTEVRVVRDGDAIVAAAGWEVWPGGVAQVGVLAAPSARGRGIAGAVASSVVQAALAQDLLVQWRARPAASRRLAQRLGLVEVGWQLSWR